MMEIKKKPLAMNIVSSNVQHKGFGAGSIDLNQVSSLIIDGDEAYLDNGALHGKSVIEKGIKFSMSKEDTPQGRRCWIIWVATDRKVEGTYYAGVTACEMLVDTEARRGWKILADHVNKMDQAMKRRIVLDGLSDKEKSLIKQFLIQHNEEWWNVSDESLKQALSS